MSIDESKIYFATREDADKVLEAMRGVIKKFTMVTVSDLHDLVGLSGKSRYLDAAEGWTDLDSVEIQEIPEGFFIDLPATSPVAWRHDVELR